ncbi:MAG: GGDEF domain-containing protein [Oscillospiraceae bacterium]|nr:GGDEF domain-containing protein [Oscillospiraceae bacterium]
MSGTKQLSEKLLIIKQSDFNEKYKDVLKIASRDGIILGGRAVCTIIAFEIMLIIFTIIQNNWTEKKLYCFIGYIYLILISTAALLTIRYVKENVDSRYKIMSILNSSYDIALMLWAIYMTYIENKYSPSFSAIIFITVLVILPVVSFIRPIEYIALHLSGCICVLVIIQRLTEYGKFGNTVNFCVFMIISLISGLEFLEMRLRSYTRQIQLINIAERDELSGLYNRKKLNNISADVWNKCVSNNSTLTCVLCDIDDFKKINDKYGHISGDYWIKSISEIVMKSATKESDMFFRYGGEEFMMVLPGQSSAQACAIVENVQTKLASLCKEKGSEPVVTLSFGIYSGKPSQQNSNIDKFYSNADALLYKAKRNGKNCYCVNDMTK